MSKICCLPPIKTLLMILVNILWSTKDISRVLIKVISRNVVIKVVKRAILLARLLNKASIKVKINHNMNFR